MNDIELFWQRPRQNLFVTISYLVELLDASEATIRRDVNSLHAEDKLRKVRGGAESLHPPTSTGLAGRPFAISQSINAKAKKGIALAAAALCKEGESIIIGGGSTAFMMAEHIKHLQLDVMTNSFMIADFLLKEGKCSVTVPSGKIYREQNLILSPYPEDGTSRILRQQNVFWRTGIRQSGGDGNRSADSAGNNTFVKTNRTANFTGRQQ